MTRYFRGLTQPYLGEIEGQLGIEIQLKVRSKLFVKYIRILFALANIICIRRANILPTPNTKVRPPLCPAVSKPAGEIFS